MKEAVDYSFDPRWHRVDMGNGHYVNARRIDPKIQAQMPAGTRTFIQNRTD